MVRRIPKRSQDTSEEPLPILESGFDGKIVGWNGNGFPPFIQVVVGQILRYKMVGTKWSHEEKVPSNSQNLQDALRSLVGQEPDDDILLSRDIINDLRIGKNLDYTNFGNPTENEIQRIINVDWRDEGNPDDFQTNQT